MNRLEIFTIGKHDDIQSIIDRIEASPADRVMLLLPKKHPLLFSLRDMRHLAELFSDRIEIKTEDEMGRKMVSEIGIRLTPLAEEIPDDSKEKNEVMTVQKVGQKRFFSSKKIKKEEVEEMGSEVKVSLVQRFSDQVSGFQMLFGKPSVRVITAIVVGSLGLLLLILWIALPGAVITIEPRSEVIEQVLNVTLTDEKKYQKPILGREVPTTLPSKKVETRVEKSVSYQTTNKVFEGTNAMGYVRMMNSDSEGMTLRSKTRLATADGLVFRTQEFIKIPPQSLGKDKSGKLVVIPGSLRVQIEADPFDIYGQPIGSRGNVGGAIKFTVPGLSGTMQKKVWGELEGKTAGGLTRWKYLVNDAEVDAAKKKLADELTVAAKAEIDRYISDLNVKNSTKLTRLKDDEYLSTNVDAVQVPASLVGTATQQFTLTGSMTVSALAYDDSLMRQVIEEKISTRVHPEMVLADIAYSDAVYKVFEVKDGNLKMSVSVRGREEFAIGGDTKEGQALVERVRKAVMGLSVSEAKKHLSNFREVSDANISVWPFFLSSMPTLPENISVKVKE